MAWAGQCHGGGEKWFYSDHGRFLRRLHMGVRQGQSKNMPVSASATGTQQSAHGAGWVGSGAVADMTSLRCLTSVWRCEGQLVFLVGSFGERLELEM